MLSNVNEVSRPSVLGRDPVSAKLLISIDEMTPLEQTTPTQLDEDNPVQTFTESGSDPVHFQELYAARVLIPVAAARSHISESSNTIADGAVVGLLVGANVGSDDGLTDGCDVGDVDGIVVGYNDGFSEGCVVGDDDGTVLTGAFGYSEFGGDVGNCVGDVVGSTDGKVVGTNECKAVGDCVELTDGPALGVTVRPAEGC